MRGTSIADAAKYPHADVNVVHAPGACQFCDLYPQRQLDRKADRTNFTGESDWSKWPCPSTKQKGLEPQGEIIRRWAERIAAEQQSLSTEEQIFGQRINRRLVDRTLKAVANDAAQATSFEYRELLRWLSGRYDRVQRELDAANATLNEIRRAFSMAVSDEEEEDDR